MSSRAKCEKVINDTFELKNDDNIVYFSSVTKKGREEIYSLIQKYINIED